MVRINARVFASLLAVLLAALAASSYGLAAAEELSDEQKRVIAANTAFYQAFSHRDVAAMEEIWSRREDVAVIHPGWPGISGREEVMRSWQLIMEGPGSPEVESVNPVAYVMEDSAFVVTYEQVGGGFLIATNIFALEDGAWRMVHHQAGPTPRPEGPAGDPI
jgi:ketosteroid isomerase-like protein